MGDIDGDGKADLVIWRPWTSTWYWLTSSSGYSGGGSLVFGASSLGDKPMLGDLDGDGKADLVIWRPYDGTWYWLMSSSNYVYGDSRVFGDSAQGDVPLLPDIDGDGRADIAVWRANTGTWRWILSSSGYDDTERLMDRRDPVERPWRVNKSASTDALNTLMGSRAFAAVARAVLFVMTDPDNESVRLLGQAKNNLGKSDLPTLAFRIVEATGGVTRDGPITTGKLEWSGESETSIKAALAAQAEAGRDTGPTVEAMAWLEDFLTNEGGQVDSALVKREGQKAGHNTSALQRARNKLKLATITSGFPRRTFWALQSSRARGETATNEMNETTETTGRMQSSRSFQSSQSFHTPREAKPMDEAA